MASGPVGAELRAVQAGSFTEGYQGWVGRPVTFEGLQILNRTGRPETVVAVIPTNVPPHVTLKSGVTQVPPGQGVALGWKTTHWTSVPRSLAGHRLLGSKRHDREYTSWKAYWCIIVGITTLTPCICRINLSYARGIINAEHVRPISLHLPCRGKSVYGHACDKYYPDPNFGLIYVPWK